MIDSVNVCEISFQTISPFKIPDSVYVVGYTVKKSKSSRKYCIKAICSTTGLKDCIGSGFVIENIRIKGWFKSNYTKLSAELQSVNAMLRNCMEDDYDKKSN